MKRIEFVASLVNLADFIVNGKFHTWMVITFCVASVASFTIDELIAKMISNRMMDDEDGGN